MIIYNFKKEFLGIDEQDLQNLGYANLQQLLDEKSDFADLFVKSPGFIHNFEHIHWIDYIEDIDNARAIIQAKNKKFTCGLELSTIYLKDDPSQKAYQIDLIQLRPSSNSADESARIPSFEKPILKTRPEPKKEEPEEEPIIVEEIAKIETPQEVIMPLNETEDIEEPIIDFPEKSEVADIESKGETPDLQIEFEDLSPEDTEDTPPPIIEVENIPEDTLAKESIETPVVEIQDEDNDFANSYAYDPHVASEALGLPVDLIEEFIEDFIAQARDFKTELYSSLEALDYDNLKKQAHKLKGVAANLRIEDAFDVLVVLNNSRDYEEVKMHLNRLYKIVEKLSQQESAPQKETTQTQNISEAVEDDDEDLILTFKD